jgi:hypothetical protein
VEVEAGSGVVDERFLWTGTAGADALEPGGAEGAVELRRARVPEVDSAPLEVPRVRDTTSCVVASSRPTTAGDQEARVNVQESVGVQSGV